VTPRGLANSFRETIYFHIQLPPLQTEAEYSSETSAIIYPTTWYHL